MSQPQEKNSNAWAPKRSPLRPPSVSKLQGVDLTSLSLDQFLDLVTKESGKPALNHLDRCLTTELTRFKYWRGLSTEEKEKEFAWVAGSIICEHWGGDRDEYNCYAVVHLLHLYDIQPGSTRADLLNAWSQYKIDRTNNFEVTTQVPETPTAPDTVITPEKMQEMFWKMFKDSPEKFKEFTGGFNQD